MVVLEDEPELRVLHPVQADVHAGEVVGGDVFLLAEEFGDGGGSILAPLFLFFGAGSSRPFVICNYLFGSR